MNASILFQSSRRRLVVLVAAVILALAGTGLVTLTYACQGAGGTCP